MGADGTVILTPKNPRPINKAFTMRSPEIKTREQAMSLKGTQLFVPRDVFPDPEEDEFYFSDLIGLDVKSTDGKRIGTIAAVHDFGAGTMLEIQPVKSAEKQASFFHPFTKIAVPKVDLTARRVIIHIEEAVMGRAPSQAPNQASDQTSFETLDEAPDLSEGE